MKKIVIALEKFSKCEDIFLLNNKDVDFEYLLRYMEIFKDDFEKQVIKVYKEMLPFRRYLNQAVTV